MCPDVPHNVPWAPDELVPALRSRNMHSHLWFSEHFNMFPWVVHKTVYLFKWAKETAAPFGMEPLSFFFSLRINLNSNARCSRRTLLMQFYEAAPEPHHSHVQCTLLQFSSMGLKEQVRRLCCTCERVCEKWSECGSLFRGAPVPATREQALTDIKWHPTLLLSSAHINHYSLWTKRAFSLRQKNLKGT